MKVDLKRILRFARKLVAAGAIAAAAFAGSAGKCRAALVLSNGNFASPNVSGGYGYGFYTVGSSWNVHNLGPSYGQGTHGTGNNGNLVQYTENNVSTGGLSSGQYAAAVLWDTPANVFSATVGNTPTGMYVDQQVGTINPSDASTSYTLSADLLHIIGAISSAQNSPSIAGAGVTIGFANANTGAVLAETPVSYTTTYAAGDQTAFKITGSFTWSPSASGLPVGTPIKAFIGFRLDPNYSNQYNSVAVDNLVLSSNVPTLTWTGADANSPMQWSTSSAVLNWSSSGNASAYHEGASVVFDDTAGTNGGSTTVDISNGDVNPSSVVFNNTANASYTLQGSNGIAGAASLNVAGGGQVLITNTNSFTGGTTISGGTLQLGSANPLPNSTVYVGVPGGLAFSPGNTVVTLGGLGGVSGFALNDGVNPVALTVGNNNISSNYAGAMSGAGSLIKVGTGILILSGPNTYTGGTTISGGTLQVGSGATTGSIGPGAVTNNATLAFNSASSFIPSPQAISGSGSVVQQGTGVVSIGQPNVSLNACNNISQSVYVANNTGVYTSDGNWNNLILVPVTAGSQPIGALFMVRSDATYATSVGTANTDLSSALPLNGNGSNQTAVFRWNGSIWNFLGTETLGTNSQTAVANSYTGPTTVSAGTLALLTANSLSPTAPTSIAAGAMLDLGVGSQTIGSLSGGGTVSTLIFNLSTGGDNSNQTFSGAIVGAGGLGKTGTGLQALTGPNAYSGGTTINGGTLMIGSGGAAGSIASSSVLANGTLAFDRSDNPTFASAISGTGSLVQLGGGLLTLTGNNSSFTGTTTVSSGTLKLGAGGVSGIVGGPIVDNSALVFSRSDASAYLGNISGGGSVTLSGGTLALGGANSYSGATNVNAGTLIFNGTHAGAGSYNIAGGAVLSGTGTISGGNTVTLHSGAAISPGGSPNINNIGTLTLPGLATSGGATLDFDLTNTTTAGGASNDLIQVAGNLALSGTTNVQINAIGSLASGTYTLIDYGTLSNSGGTISLAGGGLGARQTATFNYGSGANSAVTLTVSGTSANLAWIGASSHLWDLNDVSNKPWNDAGTSTSDFFASKDSVSFSNSASAGGLTVTLSGALNPGSVAVTGTNNFVFSGPGKITSGVALTVTGPGTLTLANSGGNDYTLGTNIQGGKIVLGINNGLPTAGAVTFGTSSSSGTLDLAGYSQQLGGLGIAGGAAAASQVITASSGSSTLTYAGAATAFLGTIQDTASTSGGTLGLRVGGGTLDVSGGSPIYSGATAVNSGLLIASSLPNTSGIAIAAAGALDFTAMSTTVGVNINNAGTLAFTATSGNVVLAGLSGSGTDNFNGPAVFLANANFGGNVLNLASSSVLTLSAGTQTGGSINGGGGVTMAGSGSLVLVGNNTYTGPTTVSSGTLSVNALAVGGAPSPIGASSNVAGNLVLQGGGVFQYTGSSTNIDRGFSVGAGGGAIDIVNGTQLQLSNALVLGGTLTKTDSGTLRLINYSGSTVPSGSGGMLVINQGTVDFGTGYFNASPFGYGALNIQVNPGGDLLLSAPHALGGDNGDGGTSWGVVSVLGGIMTLDREQYIHGGTVNGLGRLILQGGTVNTGSGAGPFEFRSTSNTSTISTLASAQPSVMNVNLNTTYSSFVLDVAHGTAPYDLLVTGQIFGVNGITKVNAGNLVLTNTNNTYIGPTEIDGGALQLGTGQSGQDGTIGFTSGVTDNAALVYNLFGTENASYPITGSGSLIKTGTGILILAGNNSYAGSTTVNSGTLQVGFAGAIPFGPGAGDLTASGSGVFDLAGNATNINGLWGNGTVDTSAGNIALTVGNNDATSTFSGVLQNSNTASGAFLALTKTGSGTLTLTGANTYLGGTTVNEGTLIAANSQAIYDGTSLSVGDPSLLSLLPAPVIPAAAVSSSAVVPVPEPGTLGLLAAGVTAAFVAVRRRGRRVMWR